MTITNKINNLINGSSLKNPYSSIINYVSSSILKLSTMTTDVTCSDTDEKAIFDGLIGDLQTIVNNFKDYLEELNEERHEFFEQKLIVLISMANLKSNILSEDNLDPLEIDDTYGVHKIVIDNLSSLESSYLSTIKNDYKNFNTFLSSMPGDYSLSELIELDLELTYYKTNLNLITVTLENKVDADNNGYDDAMNYIKKYSLLNSIEKYPLLFSMLYEIS